MHTTTLLTVLAAATVLTVQAQDITGDWQGTLKPAPGAELHLLLHISKANDGSLKGSWTVWTRVLTGSRFRLWHSGTGR
jgi:hypothetical protein